MVPASAIPIMKITKICHNPHATHIHTHVAFFASAILVERFPIAVSAMVQCSEYSVSGSTTHNR